MDIYDLISTFQKMAPEFASTCCVINGVVMNLNEVQNMGWDEFSIRSKFNMPLRLYRYFPDIEKKDTTTGEMVNYSIQAIENNTVFMQSPTEFDDVYDSDINISFEEYEHLRLIEYCKRCEINVTAEQSTQEIGNALTAKLFEYFNVNHTLENAIIKPPESEIEQGANRLFELRIMLELANNLELEMAISKAIWQEFSAYQARLKTVFRTACFCTTPYSQLMWGGIYANFHKGFCVEYTILPNDAEYEKAFYNLFPMIYCKVRPDMTSRIVAAKDKPFTKETLWDIYFHGALRKSIDWAFQNEWRMLLPFSSRDTTDYNVKFFPITKVFLGNRMATERRKKIIEICHEKNIPYIGVMRNPSIFEMQECRVKCEDCPRYLNSETNSV